MATDRDIRDLFSRRQREFGRECSMRVIVALVADELQIARDRVWKALEAVNA